MCVSIEGLECAGEMVTSLTQHSQSMTGLYRDLNRMTINGVDSMDQYEPVFAKAKEYSAWYAKRKRVANSMKAAATTS